MTKVIYCDSTTTRLSLVKANSHGTTEVATATKLLKQESPPAWTQEAYRPPRSKYTLCCSSRGYPPNRGQIPGWGPAPPPGCERTDACENITFPILRMRTVINTHTDIHVRARLHKASVSMQSQCCFDVSDTAVIEINGVAPEWVATPFQIGSICFYCFQWELNCQCHGRVDSASMLTLGVNGT